LCARGYAAPNKGTELCDACEPGRWSNGTGTTECASCAPGKTTDHFHAHKCDKWYVSFPFVFSFCPTFNPVHPMMKHNYLTYRDLTSP
jgi:hypothetical protein